MNMDERGGGRWVGGVTEGLSGLVSGNMDIDEGV